MPASCPGYMSSTSALKPRFSAHFRYIFSSISAQSCASVPPAPDWTEQMALSASCWPDSSISVSASDTSVSSRSISSRSSFALPASSAANSKSTSASATDDSNPSCLLTTRSMRLRCWRTFCAASWSFQKSGSDACASSLESSSRFVATSKKPPELLDARAQLVGPQTQVPVFAVTRLQGSRHSTSKRLSTEIKIPTLKTQRDPPSPQRQRQGEQADEGAGEGERVAEPDVKSLPAVGARHRPRAHGLDEPAGLVRDGAALVDARADARVGDAQERAPRLDRAEDRVREVLPEYRRVALVRVVRHLNEHVRALLREPARDVGVRRLQADESARAGRPAVRAQRDQRVALARREVADDAAQHPDARQPAGQRHVLAERHQANLIILCRGQTLFVHEHRRVVAAAARRRLQRVEEQRDAAAADVPRQLLAEAPVAFEREVHRRLRPHHDPRSLPADPPERTQPLVAQLEVSAAECFVFRLTTVEVWNDVRLHRDDVRDRGASRPRLFRQRSPVDGQRHARDRGDGDERAALAPFEECVGERGVDRQHEEADGVDAAEARRLYERGPERLRVADGVPELPDDAEPRPLARDPHERREEESGRPPP